MFESVTVVQFSLQTHFSRTNSVKHLIETLIYEKKQIGDK